MHNGAMAAWGDQMLFEFLANCIAIVVEAMYLCMPWGKTKDPDPLKWPFRERWRERRRLLRKKKD